MFARITSGITTIAVLALLWTMPANAQVADPALDRAYQAMYDDPTSVDATLEYARLAAAAGDFEAAIGALERILLTAPGLPSIHADLGLLYQRMGSLEVARYHVNQALSARDVDPQVADRARDVLARIDQAQSRHTFSGSITLGARYQSNANAGPSSSTVLASGFTVALDEDFREEDDVNLFAFGRVRHSYDLKWMGASLDTDGFLYATLHEQIHEVNNFTLEASTGPRFKVGPERAFEVRPHVVGNLAWRGNEFNSKVFGAGIDARYRIGSVARIGATYQHRRRDFTNSEDRRRADNRDGHEDHFSADIIYAFTRKLTGVLRGSVISRDTSRSFLDSDEYGAAARLILTHGSIFGVGPTRWHTHVGFGLRRIDFDAPNPSVSTTVTRSDDEWRAEAGTAAILSRQWRAGVRVSYSDVDSNLPNFTRDNLAVSLSATRRF